MQGSTFGDTPARIPVDVRRFADMKPLSNAYAYDFASVAPFFAGDPSASDSWAATIARIQAQGRNRGPIATVIAAQQQRRQAPARAVEAARRLTDPRSVAILTGQQAGLFGGPLYTLLKALSTLKLAEQVSREFNVAVVPVFWVDAEDHDWDEVRSCTVFDAELTPQTVSLPPNTAHTGTVAAIHLDQSVSAALDDLERLLPATEFTPSLLADLRRFYAPGAGMADAFSRWLEHVLGDRGLVVYDASDPLAKPLAASVFARELATPGQTSQLAGRAGAELAARGYHSQVHTQDDGLALFHLEGGRHAIRQQNGYFVAGDKRYAQAELLTAADQQPATFSPNVLLRPIVQDTLFPTVCYVAGPSELAYLGQLRQVYEHFGVAMPLVFPRASATLIDTAAYRFLSKYRLPFEALQAQDESALNELLKQQMPAEIEQAFEAATQAIDSSITRVVGAMPLVDPTLEGAARSTLGRMTHDLQTLRAKTVQAAKRRDDTLRRQFVRTRALTYPNAHPQQRVIGFVSFLNQYGPALLERLEDELPLDIGHHWIVVV